MGWNFGKDYYLIDLSSYFKNVSFGSFCYKNKTKWNLKNENVFIFPKNAVIAPPIAFNVIYFWSYSKFNFRWIVIYFRYVNQVSADLNWRVQIEPPYFAADFLIPYKVDLFSIFVSVFLITKQSLKYLRCKQSLYN